MKNIMLMIMMIPFCLLGQVISPAMIDIKLYFSDEVKLNTHYKAYIIFSDKRNAMKMKWQPHIDLALDYFSYDSITIEIEVMNHKQFKITTTKLLLSEGATICIGKINDYRAKIAKIEDDNYFVSKIRKKNPYYEYALNHVKQKIDDENTSNISFCIFIPNINHGYTMAIQCKFS